METPAAWRGRGQRGQKYAVSSLLAHIRAREDGASSHHHLAFIQYPSVQQPLTNVLTSMRTLVITVVFLLVATAASPIAFGQSLEAEVGLSQIQSPEVLGETIGNGYGAAGRVSLDGRVAPYLGLSADIHSGSVDMTRMRVLTGIIGRFEPGLFFRGGVGIENRMSPSSSLLPDDQTAFAAEVAPGYAIDIGNARALTIQGVLRASIAEEEGWGLGLRFGFQN